MNNETSIRKKELTKKCRKVLDRLILREECELEKLANWKKYQNRPK